MMHEALTRLGFSVVEAADGVRGWELANQIRPQLILTDARMPGLDGYELVRRLRQTEDLKTIPIISVSASVYEEDRQKSLAAGCDDFLPKPVEFDQLLRLIERYLPLEWLYQEHPSQPPPSASLVEPLPAEELAHLRRLTMIGDIDGLLERLAHLEALGEQYRPFIDQARQLTQQFQIEALETLLERYET
jgi:CheY-like chemotaxis protein